jgi:hypothetical protein
MPTAKDILTKYDTSVSSLGFRLRDYLLEELKGVIEYPDMPANIVGYGYGPGYTEMICTIIPSKKGIKLGFYKGSELPDPEALLTGSGRVHRHVVINSDQDLKKPALKKLLSEAVKAYQKRKM